MSSIGIFLSEFLDGQSAPICIHRIMLFAISSNTFASVFRVLSIGFHYSSTSFLVILCTWWWNHDYLVEINYTTYTYLSYVLIIIHALATLSLYILSHLGINALLTAPVSSSPIGPLFVCLIFVSSTEHMIGQTYASFCVFWMSPWGLRWTLLGRRYPPEGHPWIYQRAQKLPHFHYWSFNTNGGYCLSFVKVVVVVLQTCNVCLHI